MRCRIVSSRKRMVSRSSRSPMCWETNASRPRVMVIVFFRSAAGGDDVRPVGAEVDRVRNKAARAPEIGRRAVESSSTTESSALTTIARSWVTIRSATAGKPPLARPRRTRPAARRRDWRWSPRARGRTAASRQDSEIRRAGERVQDEPVQRRIGEHQPDVGQIRRDARSEQTPAPRQHDRRSPDATASARSAAPSSARRSALAEFATITAKGLASRAFRRRKALAPPSSSRASHRR